LADDAEALGPVADARRERAFDALGLSDEVVAFDDLEDLERRGRRDRIAAEGAADAPRLHGIHDLGASRDGSERHPARDALGARDEIRNDPVVLRSEEHTSELQSRENLVCRLLLE